MVAVPGVALDGDIATMCRSNGNKDFEQFLSCSVEVVALERGDFVE